MEDPPAQAGGAHADSFTLHSRAYALRKRFLISRLSPPGNPHRMPRPMPSPAHKRTMSRTVKSKH
jgi:hypothetical protein